MEHDPFALIEAMTIAGFATGCEKGYLYLRGEYPLALARIANAIAALPRPRLPRRQHPRRRRALRHRAAPRRRRLHLRRGDGADELDRRAPRRAAQQAALPDRGRPVRQADGDQQRRDAGQRPRHRPRGGAGVRRASAPSAPPAPSCSASPGTSKRPGVYEVPFGITLRELLDLAGGGSAAPDACRRSCSAARRALSSAPSSSTCRSPSRATRAIGATLGSAWSCRSTTPSTCARSCAASPQFFRDESCGQCVPCRVGTVRQEELLHRLATDRAARLGGGRDGAARGAGPGDARRLDLRPRSDRLQRHRVGARRFPSSNRRAGDAMSSGRALRPPDPVPAARCRCPAAAPAARWSSRSTARARRGARGRRPARRRAPASASRRRPSAIWRT